MRSAVLAVSLAASVCSAQEPTITASAAVLMDAESGEVLFSRNAHEKRAPASTTKILTALLALERIPAGSMIYAPANADKVTGSSAHLRPGESMTREDALFALMLRSANDVAEAIAVHVSKSVPGFALLMNSRAKEIGCEHTSFTTPHGLPDDRHLTCAYDLALIGREAMKNEFFKRVVSTPKWTVMRSDNQKDTVMENNNKLLLEDAFIEGIKTGYTRAAGRCFVGSRSENGLRLIAVVLNSNDWAADTRALYAWGYEQVKLKARYKAGDIVGEAPVENGIEPAVKVAIGQDLTLFTLTHREPPTLVLDEVEAPILKGEAAGVLRYVSPSGETLEAPVLFAETIQARPMLFALAGNWASWAALGLAGVSLALFRTKSRPRRTAHAR